MPGFSINLIRVGAEQFTPTDEQTIQKAVSRTRAIYATQGFFVGTEDWFIPNADALGYSVIDQTVEAQFLTVEWTINNNAIDVFLVKEYVGQVAGVSPPPPGTCDKNLPFPFMTGSVVELVGDDTSIGLPHEVGHYLGLDHEFGDRMNLMYPEAPNGGRLRFDQGDKIRGHCFVID